MRSVWLAVWLMLLVNVVSAAHYSMKSLEPFQQIRPVNSLGGLQIHCTKTENLVISSSLTQDVASTCRRYGVTSNITDPVLTLRPPLNTPRTLYSVKYTSSGQLRLIIGNETTVIPSQHCEGILWAGNTLFVVPVDVSTC